MPTTRPRHAVTETPDIAAALATAAEHWPADRDKPGRLLRHLIREGRNSIVGDLDTARADRLTALNRISGFYPGLYEPRYLEKLREDFPK